jgi:hypothetical protein
MATWKKVWVPGYTKNDGTKVKGHYRSAEKQEAKILAKMPKAKGQKSFSRLNNKLSALQDRMEKAFFMGYK